MPEGARRRRPPPAAPPRASSSSSREIHRVISGGGPGGLSSSSTASRPWPRPGAATACWATSSCSPAPTSTTASRWPTSPCCATATRFHASTPIAETTQIFVDVYRHKGRLYLHPTKVQQRYSPTMYMLHAWEGDEFLPVTESSTIAEILTARPWAGLESVRLRLGKWNRTFLQAEEVWEDVQRGQADARTRPTGSLPDPAAHGHLARRARHCGWPRSTSRWPTCWASGSG